MQTKQQIQQLLVSAGASANRRLGQHFLIDLNLMRLLVDSANIRNNDIVLEVGCGTGSLTEALADKAAKVIAVEFDRTLAQIAKSRLATAGNVQILQTDILENKNTINPAVKNTLELARKKCHGRFLLVSNLPYNVASPVMLNLVKESIIVDSMCVTVQKEIADRMTAQPRSKHYGTLSIFLSVTGNIRIIRTIKPAAFWPKPRVNSAMVNFTHNQEKSERIQNVELFSEVINLFIGHRRKMIKTCSKLAIGKLTEIKNWTEVFEQCSIEPTNRPEQITPEDYLSMANLCYEYLQ